MIPILLSGLTKDGSRLVRLPKVSAGSRRESEGLPQATCDDPIYETSPSADGSHSLNKPYSVFKVKAQNSRSQLNKDVSSSSIPESQEAKDFSKVSGSSGHSSTGFGKGSSLNPEKSVVLVHGEHEPEDTQGAGSLQVHDPHAGQPCSASPRTMPVNICKFEFQLLDSL